MKSSKLFFLLQSFISPILAIQWALKYRSDKFKIFAGTVFFGIIGSLFIYSEGIDGTRHLEAVKNVYINLSFNEFLHLTKQILLMDPEPKGAQDLYIHFLAYIAGTIFQTPPLLHVLGGLILGYFFSKSALLIIQSNNKHSNILQFTLLIILFLTIRSISALNSLRFYTGMWILFYGYIAYLKSGRKKYFLIMVASVAIHIAYFSILIPVIGSLFLLRRKLVVVLIYISSIVFSFSYVSIESYIPKVNVFQEKQKIYITQPSSNLEIATAKETTGNFYVKYGHLIYTKVSMNLLIATYILSGLMFINNDKLIAGLLTVSLLLMSMANIVTFAPELVSRTFQNASIYLVAATIVSIKLNLQHSISLIKNKVWTYGVYLFIITAIPYWLFHLSYALNTVSFFVILLPIISLFLGDLDFSVIDFFRFIM